jgi:pSer/pThr/pTyr-binding forkhead associated (FHA) protein
MLIGDAPIFVKIPIRALALTPVGIFLGLGVGASSLNMRRAIMGAIGGLIGGLVGSILFDPISSLLGPLVINVRGGAGTQEVGIFGRAAYCILLGAGVGLFVGLVENYAKTAWLRLSLGRNEGREWYVDGPLTVIGRGEMCQVPLFGDMAVQPRHATIAKQGDQYILTDENTPTGTYLNGQRITQVPLFHGANIQIGGYTLQFLMKQGQVPINAGEMLRAQQHYAATGQASAPVGLASFQPAPAGPAPGIGIPNVPSTPSVPTQMTYPAPAPAPVPAPQAGAPVLAAIAGPLTGQRFPIGANLEVGREGSGIALGFDTHASRKHASFMATPGGIILTDLGSTNGTFVNDQPVQAATLSKGDTVRIGVTTFRVE